MSSWIFQWRQNPARRPQFFFEGFARVEDELMHREDRDGQVTIVV
jgi:hypothetical protein